MLFLHPGTRSHLCPALDLHRREHSWALRELRNSLENGMVKVALCSKDTTTEQPRVGGASEGPTFCGKGREHRRDCLEPCPAASWKPPARGTLAHPWEVVPANACSYCRNCFLTLTQNPSQCYLCCCSLSSPRGSL